MNLFVTILLAILIFGVIIIIHELGHFLTAKAVGIAVPEFSIAWAQSCCSGEGGDQVHPAPAAHRRLCGDGG